ncbi:MAG: glycosyltransferase [Candidatus Saganbacteria bacterium]|nr:glycosyltransferase [Candidatus Saganbacteria bacterium]
MKISVVIGTYNQKDTLKTVLESFSKQLLPASEFELVVADSSSSDGTEQMVRSFNSPYQLNYLRLENKGKAYARNRGVAQAKTEIILLTDADMVAAPDLLSQHVAAQEKYGDAAIEGVTLNLTKELKAEELCPESPYVEPYIKQNLQPGQKLKWSYFLSGNLSLRKQTFLEAGGFDENFSSYGWEDIELGYRFKKLDVPLIYAPEAINYHFHFVTSQDMLKRKYNMGKSAAYFYKKHPNFEIKMFLGLNPLAMGIFYLLKALPSLRKMIRNQYIQEEYQYRLGLTKGLSKPHPLPH